MNKIFFLLVIFLSALIILNSCGDKKANCELISQSIVDNNEQMLKNEINKLCATYKPFKTGSDAYGQQQNLTKLTESISGNCAITISDVCYNCVNTTPPISTFKITFNVDTTTYAKTIEIGLTPYNRLTYIGIRD
jgi:hypothetical protein